MRRLLGFLGAGTSARTAGPAPANAVPFTPPPSGAQPAGNAFAQLDGRPPPIVRLGSVRQGLAGGATRALGSVHAEAWWKTGFSLGQSHWATVHEQGWRMAMFRLRAAALSRGANAVLNLRYRLAGGGDTLGFLLHGDAVTVPGLDAGPALPCVPWNATIFALAMRAGVVPIGCSVGAIETVDVPFHYDAALAPWGGGETPLLGQWKRQARDAALARLTDDPLRAFWTGALAHDEIVSISVETNNGVITSCRLRAAITQLGYRRLPGTFPLAPTFLAALDDHAARIAGHRPLFAGIENGVEVAEEDADLAEKTELLDTAVDLAGEERLAGASAIIGAAIETGAAEATGAVGDLLGNFGDLFS
ncbi:hypothetical protein [Gluconacetobacter asukensis]|uniref:Uncharacterized protein n=1 Tax=Gluconacetobacter asukensis TaxID=1017181 RepID=A0A7W4J113_9PROT|nr:hypothetical protein [Gluconacetobacter asukensis]MBB2172743.1 hypothetical protein [Gluconacetobacter asukensis]